MQPIVFHSAVVTRREDGELVIALMDRVHEDAAPTAVALLKCPSQAGFNLAVLIASELLEVRRR